MHHDNPHNKRYKNTPLSLFSIKNELKQKCTTTNSPLYTLSKEEEILIHTIKEQTKLLNQNNVTRTRAYFQFHKKYPEIQWALLGHMVSRNGGWNMTDLKGDLYTKLLSEKDQFTFFSFLERGNWLIFQDVYPQFLLYEQSVKKSTNLFHLLSHLHVSTFMETIWNSFWKTGDKKTLAIATIINEQNYLEKRVIQNEHFKKNVLNSIGFKLFDFFQFNHILFPFYESKMNAKTLLIGDTMKHFTSLHERILLGKRLYTLLFHNEHILSQVKHWADNTPHTGSRKDYWPHLFSSVNESFSREFYKRRIKNCQLRNDSYRIYSPALMYAWKNVKNEETKHEDWFNDWQVIHYLTDKEEHILGQITEDYCKTLEKIELAILAKKNVLLREEE
ncbi:MULTISPECIES: DUF2515 domain-containing protein [Bacillus]|uniref:DUF2515 domain-containing protein n=1 Tax=Bacillus TaxID=1386 RepID=UPI000B49CD11|nr:MULTISPECIES: DUF2515 domain-containing protein [Bacillus]PER23436.1 DUF2515 domain-containing protein [Bacillus cereus]PGX09206.1 DUF2515 domain-containing protein [Bacillus sp. AFS033286]PGZ69535.1 DUF2515 domain-containing protein [Bacillus sp. AFS029637]